MTAQPSGQGLLTDLTATAQERGWDKKISESASVTARYDANGEMGGDKWYGVPNYGEFVLAYYNDDLVKKHNVTKPTDLGLARHGLLREEGRRPQGQRHDGAVRLPEAADHGRRQLVVRRPDHRHHQLHLVHRPLPRQ
ncbi:hypothetical protein OG257_03980 [Streptomyces sp. NBC_00683]|uniref:hypothetical protein n=1 Tax=Streptomyces sp. NBC_00683 TaxID=2903670 RepID=UPI002E3183A6|nr:hypothetical protein [Streptomyces sp. NBC_00683]